METKVKSAITVETTVNAPIEKVWSAWTEPQHITKWCQASDEWHAPYAENDLKANGKFKTTMAAKDGSFSFDFTGVYTNVKTNSLIEYTMEDGRKCSILFASRGNATHISETFDPESENDVEIQRAGWQAILNNFKKYTEGF